MTDHPTNHKVVLSVYPISSWVDCDAALCAAAAAFETLRRTPTAAIAKFLRTYAERIEARSAELCATAHAETGEPLLNYPCWAAPILAQGLLYLRGNDRLVCLDLRLASYPHLAPADKAPADPKR